jgi:1-deoxy-D-xylulose-5-phosphate synthase
MEKDPEVVAITAGMCKGTGLDPVREKHPGRYFDVGIAEEHAAVFAAGLGAAGKKPVVAIYATFMHRAVDCVLHDVCLQNLPVLFCLDRAGIVQDGPTHHGIHDLAFWLAMPRLEVMQPADVNEMQQMIALALERGVPTILRYAKGDASPLPELADKPVQFGQATVAREGADVAIWCLGREVVHGLETAELLAEKGIQATVVNTRFVQPLDTALLRRQAQRMPVVTLEDHSLAGGLGDLVRQKMARHLEKPRLLACGWPKEEFVPHGSSGRLRKHFGLDSVALADRVERFLEEAKANGS